MVWINKPAWTTYRVITSLAISLEWLFWKPRGEHISHWMKEPCAIWWCVKLINGEGIVIAQSREHKCAWESGSESFVDHRRSMQVDFTRLTPIVMRYIVFNGLAAISGAMVTNLQCMQWNQESRGTILWIAACFERWSRVLRWNEKDYRCSWGTREAVCMCAYENMI